MGPPSYMWFVVDQNVILQSMTVMNTALALWWLQCATVLRTTGLLELKRIDTKGEVSPFLSLSCCTWRRETDSPVASGSHHIPVKGASLRMQPTWRKAEQSTERNWDLGAITELPILLSLEPLLPLDFQLCEIIHFLICKAKLSCGFQLLALKSILTDNTKEICGHPIAIINSHCP